MQGFTITTVVWLKPKEQRKQKNYNMYGGCMEIPIPFVGFPFKKKPNYYVYYKQQTSANLISIGFTMESSYSWEISSTDALPN